MARRRHSQEEKRQNLTAYLNARGGTYRSYISYMALLGESFANRIDLLEQLLNEAHFPTTGRYKESLLADLIADFASGRYSVRTGFVLFPIKSCRVEGHGDEAEGVLATEQHVPSKQMDIIVYDSHSYPVIFRDGNVVIVRPEAVRCLIEIKGQIDHGETDDMVDKFVDFALKWRACVECYGACGVSLTHRPTLLGMAWAIKPDAGLPSGTWTRPDRAADRRGDARASDPARPTHVGGRGADRHSGAHPAPGRVLLQPLPLGGRARTKPARSSSPRSCWRWAGRSSRSRSSLGCGKPGGTGPEAGRSTWLASWPLSRGQGPAEQRDCVLILESKGFSQGLDYAHDQGKEYAATFPSCRVVATNGYCYKSYRRKPDSADFEDIPAAYLNLLRPRKRYPLVASGQELLSYLLPQSAQQ